MTSKQFIDFGKLLLAQENALKGVLDELAGLEVFIQSNESEGLVLIYGADSSINSQAGLFYDGLVSFPLKSCPRNAVSIEKYYFMLSLVFLCVPNAYRAICSNDLTIDEQVKIYLKESRKMLEKSLDLVIELKQKNGIN